MKKYGETPIPLVPIMKFKESIDTGKPLILTEEEKSELRTALAEIKSEKPNRRVPKELIMINQSLIKIISMTLEQAQ